MVNLTEREKNVLVALLRTLRPWVELAARDEEMNGGDLIEDFAEWMTTKNIDVRSIDAICDKLG